MCVGVPMQIIAIADDTARTEFNGVQQQASLMTLDEPVTVGDFVIVHAGFAIARLDPAEAAETLRLMREILSSASAD